MSNSVVWKKNLTLLTQGDRDQLKLTVKKERNIDLTDHHIDILERLTVNLIDQQIKKMMKH